MQRLDKKNATKGGDGRSNNKSERATKGGDGGSRRGCGRTGCGDAGGCSSGGGNIIPTFFHMSDSQCSISQQLIKKPDPHS